MTFDSDGFLLASLNTQGAPILKYDYPTGTFLGSYDAPTGFPHGLTAVVPVPDPACSDGLDNDNDGFTDSAQDPGCADPSDTSEQDPNLPCDDGLDNDGDNLIDLADPACRNSTWSRENAECQDGNNNDGDDAIDFDGGASIWGEPIAPPDPQCGSFWDPNEAPNPPSACGVGPGLAVILPFLGWSMRRRHARRVLWTSEKSGKGCCLMDRRKP